MTASSYGVVIPTVGRQSLDALLRSLSESHGELPDCLVVVDDRAEPSDLAAVPSRLAGRVTVVRSGGRGPAAARNIGWRSLPVTCEWVVFLDDDVLVGEEWLTAVRSDLDQPRAVAGVQGVISVPLPRDRRPTDWERATAGLESAAWITADMAYRRRALDRVSGFDERFPRAFREDADLALRIQDTGARLVRGHRQTTHPVRPVGRWVSVRVQAGNADDVLMRRLHGPHWRSRSHAPRGRRREHLVVTASAALAAAGGLTRRRAAGALGAALWTAGTARFAWARVAPGPRDRDEVVTMLLSSAVIPPVATWHWLRGLWRHRAAAPWPVTPCPRAVLFDRDGTLVHDVPYNGDPAKVRPVDGAVDVVAGLRARGIRTGVVTNQSGVGRGLLSTEEVQAVNARVDTLFGGFDVWAVCPHTESDGCDCRKPRPGMVLRAAAELGVTPAEVVVVGDIGADVQAAASAGARGVLVPTEHTLPEEISAARYVAKDLAEAVRTALGAAQ